MFPQSIRRLAPVLAALVVVGVVVPALAGPADGASAAPAGPAAPPDAAALSLAADRGIPLAEAQTRMAWQAAAPGLADTLSAQPGYGGAWIDPADGDRVKVGMVSGGSRVASAAAAKGLTGAVDVVPVRWTAVQLNAANDWLAQQLTRVNAGTKGTLAAGLRPELNSVELLTPAGQPLTEAQQAVVERARTRFGTMLRIGTYAGTTEATACSYPYCDAPLRAGVRITNSGSGCTAGFLARSRTDNVLYQFTAGHCAINGYNDTWSTALANRAPRDIGAIGNRFVFGAGGDAAIIQVADPAFWVARAWVQVTGVAGETTRDDQYTIGADGGTMVNMRICATGAFTGSTQCGNVLRLGQTRTYLGRTVTGLGESSICAVGGDSGAPVYASNTAYGLIVARDSLCDSFYQGIRGAENALNVNVAFGS